VSLGSERERVARCSELDDEPDVQGAQSPRHQHDWPIGPGQHSPHAEQHGGDHHEDEGEDVHGSPRTRLRAGLNLPAPRLVPETASVSGLDGSVVRPRVDGAVVPLHFLLEAVGLLFKSALSAGFHRTGLCCL
jgi:hypothetical protein